MGSTFRDLRVLVTGGSGFLGTPVSARLLANPALAVTFATRDPAALRARFPEGSYEVLAIDILDESSWRSCDFSRYARMLHMAWGRLDDFEHADHLSLLLPRHQAFLRNALAQGIPSLAVTGTCLEYGLKEGCLREDMPAAPVTAYAMAKDRLRASLEQLRAIHRFSLKWIRVFYPYGPGQQPKSLLAQLDAALARGDRQFDMSPGDQQRDYLPVQDMAERIVRIFLAEQFDGIVNCCSGAPITVRRLVEAHLAARGAQMQLRLGILPYPKYEPFAFWGDTARLEAIASGDR
jgi:dTDP-6-deoxy-L-talose 4-dehydrogenase (NAD+)